MPDSHNTCRRTLEGKQTKKARKSFDFRAFFAEREGFEPPEVLPSTVFKTAAIDHSAISPKCGCKGRTFF